MTTLLRIAGVMLVTVPVVVFVGIYALAAIEIPIIRWVTVVVAVAYAMIAGGSYLLSLKS